ncbi:TetR/AcrR family transcriptional regulator [Kitasatospora sp. NPDC096204]|uniref:TetR/AcrR family transcriptional regulator n=1 Tax=Kitasatospora sp. NPDC096204 TaxID=3364094 RepID=UPI00380697F3
MARRSDGGSSRASSADSGSEIRQAPARPEAVLQRRGVARVKAILDAAEEILVEGGYEAATLKAIGERTGIPTASVYHYFADRYQVDAAIIRRHADALIVRLDRIDGEDFRSISDVVVLVLDEIVEHFRAHPSCVELWFAGRNEALIALIQEFDDQVSERVWRLGIGRGLLRAHASPLVMRLAFEAGGHLFDIAFKRDPNGDEVVMAEAKRMVSAYLETYAATNAAARTD